MPEYTIETAREVAKLAGRWLRGDFDHREFLALVDIALGPVAEQT